jgi:adenosylcobinamide kinase/adenosylcobinamide-phosphate guanylyltransferase
VAHLTLVTGGARSGKSAHAQRLAEAMSPPRIYLATCPVVDQEMAARIRQHQAARSGRGWQTLEEPLELARALRAAQAEVVVVECLALWINNLMFVREQADPGPTPNWPSEREVAELAGGVLAAAAARTGAVIFVTNEVGLGIVPDNPAARVYRDLLGRCNQTLAAGVHTVTLLVSGLPWTLKESIRQ